jgi:membrane associated rhomboid family serine protease
MIPLRDNIPSRQPPVITYLFIGANILFFLFELTLPRGDLERLIFTYGFIPGRFVAQLGEAPVIALITPIFTSMFLHGGWLHLISNVWTLFIFGDNVEDTLGHGRYLFFYLACGVVAALAQMASGPWSPVPMIGASGAIGGVMGAYFALFPFARILTLVPVFLFLIIEVPAYIFLGVWFVMQFFSGTLAILGPGVQGGVAFWAHVGGFAAGYGFIRLLVGRRSPPPLVRRGW